MKKDLLNTFLVYGLGNGLSKIVPLLLLPVFTNIFTPEEYGVLELVNTIVLISSIFGMLQLDTALQRFYYEKTVAERKKLVHSIGISVILFTSITVILVIAFSSLLSELLFRNKNYASLLVLSSPLILLTNLNTLFAIILRYLKKVKTFSLIIFFQTIIISLMSLFFVLKLNWGLYGMISSQLIALFVSCIMFIFFTKKDIYDHFSFTYFKEACQFALPVFPARIGSFIYSHANKFFIVFMLSLADTGLYGIALKVASGVHILTNAFRLSWQPFMYENYQKESSHKNFSQLFTIICFLVVILSMGISIFSEDLLGVLIRNVEFADAFYLVGALATSFLFGIIKTILDIGAQVSKKTIFMTYQYVIVSAISLISLFTFIPFWGVKGVAFSLVLSSICNVLISFYLTKKLYPMPFGFFTLIITLLLASSVAVLGSFVTFSLAVKILYGFILLIFITVSMKKYLIFKGRTLC